MTHSAYGFLTAPRVRRAHHDAAISVLPVASVAARAPSEPRATQPVRPLADPATGPGAAPSVCGAHAHGSRAARGRLRPRAKGPGPWTRRRPSW
jgi:hypothetical protein